MDRDLLGGLALRVDLNHSRRLGHMLIIILHSDPVLTCTRAHTYMNMIGDQQLSKIVPLRGRDKCGERQFLNIYFSYTKTQDQK